MPKSATDVMHDIVFSAVVDAMGALKTASAGVPNALLRDINAIHANATFADLPKELQATVTASVRAGFNKLLKEGYAVSPSQGSPTPPRPTSSRPTSPRPTAPRPTPPRPAPQGAPRPATGSNPTARPPRPPSRKPGPPRSR